MEAPPPTTGTRHRILLVDDTPVNQIVAAGLLRRFGYEVTSATNGVEALRHFRDGAFAAILMDLQMPEMDGIEATRRIRELEGTAKARPVPIIAMTANCREEDRRNCFAVGMTAFLGKPFEPDELAGIVAEEIARADATGQAEAGESPPLADKVAEASAWLDLELLRKRLMHDEDLVRRVVEMSARDLDREIGRFREAFAAGDLAAARLHAHTIKGTAQNASYPHLAGLATEIDAELRAGPPGYPAERAEALVRSVRDSIDAAAVILEQLR